MQVGDSANVNNFKEEEQRERFPSFLRHLTARNRH